MILIETYTVPYPACCNSPGAMPKLRPRHGDVQCTGEGISLLSPTSHMFIVSLMMAEAEEVRVWRDSWQTSDMQMS